MAKTLSDQLRDVIDDCGMSRYRLSRKTGVSEAQLCRFMAGEGLSVKSIDKIGECLGLNITTPKQRKRKRR